MWRIPINFITLHYVWIIGCGLLGLVVIAPEGNIKPIDAYFFGASASTESGLNTIDVKELRTYQQLYIYFIPIITNFGVINIFVVVARLLWFKKRFKVTARTTLVRTAPKGVVLRLRGDGNDKMAQVDDPSQNSEENVEVECDIENGSKGRGSNTATAQPSVSAPNATLSEAPIMSSARSIHGIASSVFILDSRISSERRLSQGSQYPRPQDLPGLSRQVTIGRNSQFHDLSVEDEERLGGIEYRSLKVLLKIVIAYYFGLHLIGIVGLVPWIHTAEAKYTEWLAACGQDKTWWAFYSAQTMINNLGFTLTPDSMITFRDATWPMLLLTFLAFAGNTLYPVFLRGCIWLLYIVYPASSSTKESLRFLLDHPRRCYTLLFPSGPTWILFAIIAILNFIDVVFIVVLDLNNAAVNDLPMGPRILSALFQAASSRHTGTSTLNLANINPAVQFSLLVMMYIAILPISISIRASNTYEEQALGIYGTDSSLDEAKPSNYILTHLQNQLSFDLWYIFLGTFCVCIAESERIVDLSEPARPIFKSFSVFSIFFEVVSAYGNVGLSLGHPTVMTSLSGQFTTFSKLVICAMMIRGRHRGLPYAIDRAVMLPGDSVRSGGAVLDFERTPAETSYSDGPVTVDKAKAT